MRTPAFLLGALSVMVPCAVFAARQGEILFYPTAVKEGVNLLSGCSWNKPSAQYAPHAVAAKGCGGPRDANAGTMSLENTHPEYAYWQTLAGGVRPERTYLLGVWAKIENAKILLWWNGIAAGTGKKTDKRVYCNSGCSPILEGYFDDDTKRRLSGDPDEWRMIARTFTLPAAMLGDAVSVECGFVKAPGKAMFAEPFLVDVTGLPQTMEIEMRGVKPVKRLMVIRSDTRDPEWRKEFETPVTEFSGTPSGTSPAFYGLGADPVAGLVLIVTYADRSEDRVSFPTDGLFLGK